MCQRADGVAVWGAALLQAMALAIPPVGLLALGSGLRSRSSRAKLRATFPPAPACTSRPDHSSDPAGSAHSCG